VDSSGAGRSKVNASGTRSNILPINALVDSEAISEASLVCAGLSAG